MASVVLNGVTYTDDANAGTGMANGGHRVRFVPCLANFVAEAATQLALQHASRDAADASEAAALASQNAAAASALSALNSPGTNATSTTSLTFGTGSKTLTIQTGKDLVVGQFVSIAYTTDANNWMQGVITSYNSGTGSLTVNVGAYKGTGTFAVWTIGLSGPDALPSQATHSGKYLTTSGSVASWVVPALVTTSTDGNMSAADKTKLNGVATGATANLGTVTSVTGTAPVTSSGGTTPAISMAAATSSVNGYMTSTYAGKLDGLDAKSRSRSYFYGNF